MMINQNDLLLNLKNKTTDFAYPLTLEGVFLEDKYEDLLSFVIILTTQLKDEDYILKGILIELRLTISAMENFQGRYQKDKIENKISKVEKIFGCLVSGEVYGDRVPGVPRII
ncbi:hypothetical protein AAGQ96_03250 [Pantoea sp. MBD-2R]|uniref:hypothetical protein n=1 Tax=Pantoea sp. MBD-2R TaxID=3141540 RepID=UPI0031844B60